MIRQLAQCPYCGGCEVALDDEPALIFNPEQNPPVPCAHLAWVDGRYSQWELLPPGINREIGSTEFRWDPPEPDAADRTDQLRDYLELLVDAGPGWEFAPSDPFVTQTLVAEGKATDENGTEYTIWDVDGWAIFAQDATAFWAALPVCRERHLESLRVDE